MELSKAVSQILELFLSQFSPMSRGLILHMSNVDCFIYFHLFFFSKCLQGLKVIDLQMPDYMRILETSIQFGLPVLLQNVQEKLDPSLDPILNKSLMKIGKISLSLSLSLSLCVCSPLLCGVIMSVAIFYSNFYHIFLE